MSPVDTNAKSLPDLDLLPAREPISSRHLLVLTCASIAVHVVFLTFFFSLPDVIPPARTPIITSDLHRVIHLTMPKFDATQKAPNLTKVVIPQLDVMSEVETPRPQAPKFRPPQPAPGPVVKAVPVPAPPVLEPPKIQVAAATPPPAPPTIAPPPSPTGTTTQAPPPPASSQPKISFENVGPAAPIHANGPVDPRLLARRASDYAPPTDPKMAGQGGVSVGDTGDDRNAPNLSPTQSRGRTGSNLQLLSDANGFDFKPYLNQVLQAVRRNWLVVMPHSVINTGRRGQVVIQFIIDRSGGVPKLVIANSSGTGVFDRAAVEGVSMSTPFPQLPAEFKGDQIRLQLSFQYNGAAR